MKNSQNNKKNNKLMKKLTLGTTITATIGVTAGVAYFATKDQAKIDDNDFSQDSGNGSDNSNPGGGETTNPDPSDPNSPAIKQYITGVGNLNVLFSGNKSSKENFEHNLSNYFNKNKANIIANYSNLDASIRDNFSLSVQLNKWSNQAWGTYPLMNEQKMGI